MLVNMGSNHLSAGVQNVRFGNSHPTIVPYSVYPTADSMIALAVGNDGQFARCSEVLGHPEWAQDARFVRNRDRVANKELLEQLVAEAFKHDGVDAWIAKLQAVGVPCGRINTIAEAFADPHTAARGMVETAEHPKIGTLKMVGTPFKFSATPTSIRYAPPTIGQHTDEILREVLTMDAAQIASLRADKVV
jgi:succinate--hydroxymethylglutarate CoA-transferase